MGLFTRWHVFLNLYHVELKFPMLWTWFYFTFSPFWGLFKWLGGKESVCQCRRLRFGLWVGKIHLRRRWWPTPQKPHGQRSLAGCSPWGWKELQTTEHVHTEHTPFSLPGTLLNASVQFSHSVASNSLRPHGLQHARLPWPSATPRACPNSFPSSQWYHPTISSSVVPFSSCPQSFPASGSFPMNRFFASRGQSIGVSPSASVLPVNTQDWFPLGLTGLISLNSKGLRFSQGDPDSINGQRDPLEKGMAAHSSILTWRIPWTEEPGGLQSMGLQSRT